MQIFPENYNVTIGFAFTDLNGAPVVPTHVRAVLYDGDDQVVVDFGPLPIQPTDMSKDIVVPAAFNTLAEGQLEAARILRVVLVTESGDIRRSSSYIIQGEVRLELMINSFVSLEAAELVARDIPMLAGWNSASETDKYAALITSYNRLIRIPMRFKADPQGVQYAYPNDRELPYRCRDAETVIPAAAWSNIAAEEFLTFPAYFRKAVRMAQVAEANELLENDVTNRKHRAGIISETVGESSVMLRGGRLDLGVSTKAAEYLAGHVYYNFRVSR